MIHRNYDWRDARRVNFMKSWIINQSIKTYVLFPNKLTTLTEFDLVQITNKKSENMKSLQTFDKTLTHFNTNKADENAVVSRCWTTTKQIKQKSANTNLWYIRLYWYRDMIELVNVHLSNTYRASEQAIVECNTALRSILLPTIVHRFATIQCKD